jgi:subtilase family serine protease
VTTYQIFQQFAAQGQSFFLASGDSGAFSDVAIQPSDNPYIIVVGGTTLTTDRSGAWRSETTWSGSSGGISTLFPIPTWQRGIDMRSNRGSTTMRNMPDVAMIGDNVWALTGRGRSGAFVGTSIATPLWAGFTALINEQASAYGQPPVGFLNPVLYAIARGPDYTNLFHDITTGNNRTAESPDRFYAVRGYDLCTGWGTPTGTNLTASLRRAGRLAAGYVAVGVHSQRSAGGPNVTSRFTHLRMSGRCLKLTIVNTSTWLNVTDQRNGRAGGPPRRTVALNLRPPASLSVAECDALVHQWKHGSGARRQFNS